MAGTTTTLEPLDNQAARTTLTAILAAIDTCPADHQMPMLRQFLERGLDQLQWIEDSSHDYLAESAVLAAQNLQDIRLQDLEERVKVVESPDAPTIAELATEFAIVLAVELALVGLVHVAVGALLAWAGGRVLSRSARAAKVEVAWEASRLSAAKQRLDDLKADRRVIESRYMLSSILPSLFPPGELAERYGKKVVDNALDQQRVQLQIQTIERALAADKKAADHAAKAYEEALNNPDASTLAGRWERFRDGAFAGTVLSRVAEDLGAATASRLPAQAAPPERSPAFLSSETVGIQLTHLRRVRLAAADEYSHLRHYLRSLDDDQVATDETVQNLAAAIVWVVPELEARQMSADLIRSAVVAGYELVLWYQWLATTGVLAPATEKEVAERFELRIGAIHKDVLITEDRGVSMTEQKEGLPKTFHHYGGLLYPGIPLLSEFQTEYLFSKFAKQYFLRGLSTLPFEFDPVRYTDVRRQPKDFYLGFLPNSDRSKRLNEMRLMVILFFTQFFERVRNKETFRVTMDDAFHGRDWLDLIPQVEQDWDESLVDPAVSLEESTDAFAAMFTDLGMDAAGGIEDALQRLRSLLTDLDLSIVMYELVAATSYEPADTPLGQSDTEIYDDIQERQAILETDWDELLKMAAEDPQQQAAIKDEFDERVTRLRAWIPREKKQPEEQEKSVDWRWYGPETPEPTGEQ